MESLLKKLQQEVGLTPEQAKQAVSCVRSYMIENGLEPDWDDFLKNKAKNLSGSAKTFLHEWLDKSQTAGEKLSDKMDNWTDTAQDKLDDLSEKAQDAYESFSEKAKKTIKDVRNKAADFIADDDKEDK